MFLDHPTISALNSSTEPDRLERLNRVYGYVIGQADITGNKECITKIRTIHDSRGVLHVTWAMQPTEQEKDFFNCAWQSQIGDETDNVLHQVA